MIRTVDRVNKEKKNAYKYQEKEKTAKSEEPEPIEMVKDLICGKYVQKEKAFQTLDNQHQTLYFCSWDCRQKYIENKNG